jgi:hypothetical protein
VSALGIVVLVAGILLFIALLFALILIPVSRRAKRLRAELEAELGSAIERIENTRGLGLESRGATQTPGSPRSVQIRALDHRVDGLGHLGDAFADADPGLGAHARAEPAAADHEAHLRPDLLHLVDR